MSDVPGLVGIDRVSAPTDPALVVIARDRELAATGQGSETSRATVRELAAIDLDWEM
jgi:hypothetical protein